MVRDINPVLINTFDAGGAAKSCIRLHEGLLFAGINSHLLFRSRNNHAIRNSSQISIKTISRIEKYKAFIAQNAKRFGIDMSDEIWNHRARGLELYTPPFSSHRLLKSEKIQKADILNLHWVAGFIDFPTFFRKNKKPIVWTLHDQNPFSGGEHFVEQFLGMDRNGYPLTRNPSEFEKKRFEKNISIKRNALKNISNLTIVSPSEWLAGEAKRSEVFRGFEVHTIPYGIDSNIFQPRAKRFARELLGIDDEKLTILFVSESLENNRKGFNYLLEALKLVETDNVQLISIGNKLQTSIDLDNVLQLGSIQDELLMSIMYSAADCFVIPSLMDNLPNTALESIMCGTPIIGFPVGGIKEIVNEELNGILAQRIGVKELAEALDLFLKNPGKYDSNRIREDAVQRYDSSIQAEAYYSLFEQIIHSLSN